MTTGIRPKADQDWRRLRSCLNMWRSPRVFLAVMAALVAPADLLAQQSPDPNAFDRSAIVCGPDISAGRFKLSDIGPMISGTWMVTAPGMGFTTGVQTFPVEVSFERGRLYMGGDGKKVELHPVYGTRKALRYDFVRQAPLPETAHATGLPLEDFALITDCEPGIAAQFSWTLGSGGQSSGGVISFFGVHTALGTMWNSGQGAREVLWQR